jgi:gamma-glutamylcyclotransferase (GGCT)/AIG2-like uncharacterized protein YtfP
MPSVIGRRNDVRPPAYIALYGSLRRHGEIRGKPDLSACLQPAGEAVIQGRLIDLGDYPGLVPGAASVQAELYLLVDRRAVPIMDRFERYVPNDVRGSLYVRRALRLLRPNVEAWVYVYNRDVGDAPGVPGGDWIAHRQARPRPRG